MTTLYYDEISSPIGPVKWASDATAIYWLEFADREGRMEAWLHKRFAGCELRRGDPSGLKPRLKAYFNGDLHVLDEVSVNTGGSAFQQRVWQELREIPVGATWTYGQLASRIGDPKASRAVGHANGQNPVSIIVPCHRVIGAGARLTGYGGGLERKHWLLLHEGAILA